MTFEHEKLQKKSGIKYWDYWKKEQLDMSKMPGAFWDKVIDFIDDPVIMFQL